MPVQFIHSWQCPSTVALSGTVWSCVQVFRGNAGEVAYCSVRRSLCYPLYRHWQLVQCVLQDTRDLFHLGTCTESGRLAVLYTIGIPYSYRVAVFYTIE